MTGDKVGASAFRSVGGGRSGALSCRLGGGAVESGGAGVVGCCAPAGGVDADSCAVLSSSVCADAGDALARSHTATANRPRRRKPPITATLVVMIGIERCIAPRSAGHWLHPATCQRSRGDKQDQSPKRDYASLFARCSPIGRELRASNAECARKLGDSERRIPIAQLARGGGGFADRRSRSPSLARATG